MKISASLIILFILTAGAGNLETLSIGMKAPAADIKMQDISGKDLSLEDIAGKNGLLVIFSCNTCPFVLNWEDRYPGLGELSRKHRIGMVLVNSNEAKRNGEDSFEKMKEHAAEKNYNSYYVADRNHKVADAFGARTTPHVFLFDASLKLVYRGAIDDNNQDAAAVKEKWLENAIINLASGKPVDPAESRNIGCSIKRAG